MITVIFHVYFKLELVQTSYVHLSIPYSLFLHFHSIIRLLQWHLSTVQIPRNFHEFVPLVHPGECGITFPVDSAESACARSQAPDWVQQSDMAALAFLLPITLATPRMHDPLYRLLRFNWPRMAQPTRHGSSI
jgi:hypothetical protein